MYIYLFSDILHSTVTQEKQAVVCGHCTYTCLGISYMVYSDTGETSSCLWTMYIHLFNKTLRGIVILEKQAVVCGQCTYTCLVISYMVH